MPPAGNVLQQFVQVRASEIKRAAGDLLLPDKVVRFQMRPARPGDRTRSLPLVGQGGLEARWGSRFALIQIGGRPMRVQFDPSRYRSTATANAGVRIAAAHMRTMSGATEQVEVGFGMLRPVRSLRLKRPLVIGSLPIKSLGVRINDFGSSKSIPTETPEAADPDEIVVVGTRKRGKIFDYIRLGADQLNRCSSITFDKPAKEVRLRCL